MKALHNGGDLAATDTAAITKEITRTVTIIIITALFKVCIFMFRNSTYRPLIGWRSKSSRRSMSEKYSDPSSQGHAKTPSGGLH